VSNRTPQQTLRRLTIIVALQWMGATLGLPLLPLFLEHRGGTPTIIGFIMATFFVAGVATQFVLGRLADKFGRRLILLASLIVYGLASMTYLLPMSAPWFALARAVQGASAGAIEVASMSAVAALFSEEQRGRAVSRIIAAQLFGIAIGPVGCRGVGELTRLGFFCRRPREHCRRVRNLSHGPW
jgi:DHA1 family multidrug resistance protein-like MFS transporter